MWTAVAGWGAYVEKLTLFGHIPCEYLGQLMNFSANSSLVCLFVRIYIYIYIYKINKFYFCGVENSVFMVTHLSRPPQLHFYPWWYLRNIHLFSWNKLTESRSVRKILTDLLSIIIILWDFEIKMYLSILIKRLDLVVVKKNGICKLEDFAIPADHGIKIKGSKNLNEYLDFARELKMLWDIKVTVMRLIVGTFRTILTNMEKRLREMKIRNIWDSRPQYYSDTEKSLGMLMRRFAVTQTSGENYLLPLVW